ncbi:MAG: PAS domain S-box protein [Dehalococcoidia bacterium]|jgi:DNA-binding CsgD family transcriptional regulator
MAEKSSDKETQNRIKALERENALLTRSIEHLRESEEKFTTIFQNANDEIIYVGADGTIVDINHKVEDIFGYKREEAIGKKFYEFEVLSPEEWQRLIGLTQDLLSGKTSQTQVLQFEARRKGGEKVYLEVNPRLIKRDGRNIGILAIIRDISTRKREEELLRRHTEQLDKLLKERTLNLEELNAALKVMLKQVEEVKAEIQDKITFNITEFVMPYLEKLKKTRLEDIQQIYLNNLEENLKDIVSPFLHGLSAKYIKLTPTEIQVANMVKQGKTNKEIADTLFMSPRTIETHRYNIRSKLGLKSKKLNLRTYLLSLE